MDNNIFKEEIELIVDLNLRQKVKDILEVVDERHAHEPASSTGKYHPRFAHGDGGLIRHTKAVVMIAYELCNTRPGINRDNIIAAAILHDMLKYKDGTAYTCHEHPFLMTCDAAEAGLTQPILGMIESHMGQWNKNNRSSIVLPVPSTDEEWLLHYADYLASRTWLILTFDETNHLVV